MAKLPTEERVGAIILGRYRIVRLIEKGGMGAVYEVIHKNLGRRFAVKMLSSELSRNEEALARFRREADAIARLRHPNIVDIVDWDLMEDGSPVLVMEYLRGNTLADQITRHGPLGWGMFADIADRALSAIQVAHAAGIVHRDLKPANIFLAVDDAGQVHPKVLDFGVSKVVDSHTMLGTNPTILGTPSYMSPEQAEGRSREVGPATDVWAMGAVLYEMATGRMALLGRQRAVDPLHGLPRDARADREPETGRAAAAGARHRADDDPRPGAPVCATPVGCAASFAPRSRRSRATSTSTR